MKVLKIESSGNHEANSKVSSNVILLRISSALFYGVSSFLIIVVNKIVLTKYKFPSAQALGVGQVAVTCIVLHLGRLLSIISFPFMSKETPRMIWPLPVFYLGNLVCGLAGTKHLSLPMFTALRRFTILLTLVWEYSLGTQQRSSIILTVFAMVGGAVLAAIDDLSFDLHGYIFVLSNDVFTAASNIYVKKKLESRDLGKYGILFYNALFVIIPLIILSLSTGDVIKVWNYDGWQNYAFLSAFLLSCFMGFILMYSTVICTNYNSALTTTVVGVLKNILITYIGMYIGGDYVFSWTNFTGLNISMAGSLVYSYLIFVQKENTICKEMPRTFEMKKQEDALKNLQIK